MASRFTAAKMNEMRNAFSLFDRDGDGSISAKVRPEAREMFSVMMSCRSWAPS